MKHHSERLARSPTFYLSAVVAATAAFLCVALSDASICASTPLLCGDMSPPPAFDATFVTTEGNFTIHSESAWAPLGSARFYSLCRLGYFAHVGYAKNNQGAFFRYVPRFVVQWGIASNPAVASAWLDAIIENDPPLLSNTRGTVAYAAEYDGTKTPPIAVNRTTQVFVNLNNSNWRLDKNIFVPFGVVLGADGMKTFDNIFSGYGQEPDQDLIYSLGYPYLSANFPLLSYTNAVDVQPAVPWPKSKVPFSAAAIAFISLSSQWPPLVNTATAAATPTPSEPNTTNGAQNIVEPVTVVLVIAAVIVLVVAAFKCRRRALYTQQIE